MNQSLQQQLVALGLVKRVNTPIDRYAGLEWCRKNVVRTNNSRKLSYCKP